MKLDLTGDDFVVRVCMTTEQAVIVKPGSIVKQCAECDTDVWFDPAQACIHPETGEDVRDQTINLCLVCFAMHAALQEEQVKIVPPKEDTHE